MEILGFVAGGLELAGIILISAKNRNGFLVFVVGAMCWVTYSLLTQSAFGLIMVCSVATILNIRGYIMWGSHEKN